ncbi:UNVERIFIED_CONTAM: Monothiol glutaredoxin-S17 [Sesamum latifolium]|uniref:Monothiol glutaredoxin-S17 n=1 Tax=Sesamum latifolium TaxID=2727402 RepID=A0AAW2WN08_9LAMI
MAAAGGGAVKDVKSKAELEATVAQGAPVVLHFWASWCEASKHMDQVFSHLSIDFPLARFLRVEAEEQPEISEAYSVSAVPYFVLFKYWEPAAPASLGMAAGPTVLETVKELAKENGASPRPIQLPSGIGDELKKRLQQLVNSHPIMLFMKGSPESPKCGFSQKVVDILKKEKVKFGSFDILTENEVREGLKKFANWPTFPQLYCKGELLGGCDIAIAMHESGELREIFRDHGIDVLDSNEGKLTEPDGGKGGIVDASGLSTALSDRLRSLINSSPVMLFMKGRPDEPRCGFSRKVVDILRQEKVKFESFDILTDDEVRQGLKVYSNWSSYPQLYIRGSLLVDQI